MNRLIEAEMSVLGAVFLDSSVLDRISTTIGASDFHQEKHRELWETMAVLAEKGDPVDLTTVSTALRNINRLDAVGGLGYISELVDFVPSAANAPFYAKAIKEASGKRKLLGIAETIRIKGGEGMKFDELIAYVEENILSLGDSSNNEGLRHIKHGLIKGHKELERRHNAKAGEVCGLSTGLEDVDGILSGLEGGKLYIVAARPGMGKTAFAMKLAEATGIDANKPVGIFSMEMEESELAMRQLSTTGRVNNKKIRTPKGRLDEKDFGRLTTAAQTIHASQIYVDDQAGLSVSAIRARARVAKRKYGLSLIIVDYIQLAEASTSKRGKVNREQEVSDISRKLKGLAKDLDLPVVALSQLNRGVEQREDKRPKLSDLRESGAIEQDADAILFLYRDDYYCEECKGARDSHGELSGCSKHEKSFGITEVIVAKQRGGETGRVLVQWKGAFTTFFDAEEAKRENYIDMLSTAKEAPHGRRS